MFLWQHKVELNCMSLNDNNIGTRREDLQERKYIFHASSLFNLSLIFVSALASSLASNSSKTSSLKK